MKANVKYIRIGLITALVIMAIVCYFLLRVTESQVVVNKMVMFYEVLPNSERIIKDKEAIKQFTYAARFAEKQTGKVDMPPPEYQFTLGKQLYYLWLGDQSSNSTLMKLPDSGTIYNIEESRTSYLVDILKNLY
ncbi:MAG: hypothetical protein NAG76_18820 [Candidatus Pristimantibacillus lignocellulolyticus]|uniref:YhfM-like domain-containing protein n=1 Tax=Candidatus Pristimantibacillus lignocellulolyticus TaxID=2994561 RepID=A0A9J6ZCK7_9BACL|nr:MAG: hypothetical protein NAG76_18820 [Candidatus Pristimantibacillus lignocellulolyticus]